MIPSIEKIQSLGSDIWTRFVFDAKSENVELDSETQKIIKTYFLKRLCSRITENDCEDCESFNKGYSDAIQHIIGAELGAIPVEKTSATTNFNEYTRGWFSAKQDALLLSVKPQQKPQPRKLETY